MIPLHHCNNKKIALFGLGLSGLTAATAIKDGGGEVVVWDDQQPARDKAGAQGFRLKDFRNCEEQGYSSLVLSPGVPLTHPIPHWTVDWARQKGIEIIGDTELFFRERNWRGQNDHRESDKVIAITGTNGKSTTTALTTHLLQQAGLKSVMGGNIGYGVLDLPDLGAGYYYVLELSSYQLDLTPSVHPNAAALLNITPDHIDRHGSVENYAWVKAKIFQNLQANDTAIISHDDAFCKEIAQKLHGPFSQRWISSGEFAGEGVKFDRNSFSVMQKGKPHEVVSLAGIPSLRGLHNGQNAAAAYLLARALGVDHDKIVAGLSSFPGLEHRMQEVGVLPLGEGEIHLHFINDSKATNADATAQALDSFDAVYWIAGGRAKAGGIEPLRRKFAPIIKGYLIGEAAEDFGNTLTACSVPQAQCGTLEKALESVIRDARDGMARSGESDKNINDSAGEQKGVVRHCAVLFSPAAASFDQYANFEKRGAAFVDCVKQLIQTSNA